MERADHLDALMPVLGRARELGFLGPGDIRAHVGNGQAFLTTLGRPRDDQQDAASVLDLGSGGGVPGLVIAVARPDLRVVLLDASERRTAFLERAVEELGLTARVQVVRGRAEELARRADLCRSFDVVTARSFGPPAATLECSLGFLRGPGAAVLVSEPPVSSPDRWPPDALVALGVRAGSVVRTHGASVRRLEVIAPVPDGVPRRTGLPVRRPLF